MDNINNNSPNLSKIIIENIDLPIPINNNSDIPYSNLCTNDNLNYNLNSIPVIKEECVETYNEEKEFGSSYEIVEKEEIQDVETTSNEDDYLNLKLCDKCGIQSQCIFENNNNGQCFHFCSETCLVLFSSETASPVEVTSHNKSKIKLKDIESIYARTCFSCFKHIPLKDYNKVSWQALDFCTEKCLIRHQTQIGSHCSDCKIMIAQQSKNFGKFFMRFGTTIRQFCSKLCLDNYKLKLNMCHFCNNDIPQYANQQFDRNSSSSVKQFCSLSCVKNYCKYKLKLQQNSENFALCFICNSLKNIEVIFQQKEIMTYYFCSEICFIKFQCFNKTDAIQCEICNKIYEKENYFEYALYDNGIKHFCSKSCMTTYYIIARKIVECAYCNVKKYNFDMIKKVFPNDYTLFSCSIQCLKNIYSKMNKPISSSSVLPPKTPITPAKTVSGPLKNMTHQIVIKNPAFPKMHNASTLCYPSTRDVSTQNNIKYSSKCSQTEDEITSLLPLPVPIYVPSPVPVGYVPTPVIVPIPVPIPVPIFIPTDCTTRQEILQKVIEINNEFPEDPLQADLIKLAKQIKTKENSAIIPEINTPPNKIFQINEDINDYDQIITSKYLKRKVQNEFETENIGKKIKFEPLQYMLGINAFKQWINKRNFGNSQQDLLKYDILQMTKQELNNCLCLFINEFQKFSPDTIYYICLGIQKYLIINNKQDFIFFDSVFTHFIKSFNEIITNKSFNIISTRVNEEILWESNQLGAHSPYILLNSLIYFNTKNFKLKTVEEHFKLLSKQIIISKNNNNSKLSDNYYLKYLSLNYLNSKNSKPIEILQNYKNPLRCPVRLLEFYISKCPTGLKNNCFYLNPELTCKPSSPIWFSSQSLNKEVLEMMLNRFKMVQEINDLFIL